jgi:hypothetical protein
MMVAVIGLGCADTMTLGSAESRADGEGFLR